MSRLLYYINETKGIKTELSPKEQAKLIKKDCSYYLKLTKNTGPFNRAVYEKIFYDEILKKKTRTDRRSLGMMQSAHKEFNEWLQKNGHVRRDKSVSASSAGSSISFFGTVYYFFPVGKFNYSWVKANDINRDDIRTDWNNKEVEMFFGYIDYQTNEEEKKKQAKFPTYFTTNKGIEEAHRNKYEIWFDCKEYYLVNTKNIL